MATTYQAGRNSIYGSANHKRKNFGSISSRFADRMGFSKRPRVLEVPNVQKIVNSTLKRKNIGDPEQKYHDLGIVGTEISTGSALTLLNGIAQGDGVGSRDGAKIRITKVELHLQLILSATAAGGFDAGKVSVFLYKPANLLVPSMTAGVGTTNAAYWNNGTNSYPVIKNAIGEDNFYIIKDFDYALDSNAGVVGAFQRDSCHLRVEVPITRVIEFSDASAGTVSTILRNSMWLGYVGSQATGATGTTMNGYARVWFTDM